MGFPFPRVASWRGRRRLSQLNLSIVVNRWWELVDGNASVALLTAGAADWLLEPPINVLRLSLHPDGMAPGARAATDVVVPLRYRFGERELSFFSITAIFGTPMDVTVEELAIESFYPADEATATTLREFG